MTENRRAVVQGYLRFIGSWKRLIQCGCYIDARGCSPCAPRQPRRPTELHG